MSHIFHPNKESSARVQKEVEKESEIFTSHCVSYSLHLLGLAPLAGEIVGLTAVRLQICGRDIFISTSFFFETSVLYWRVCHLPMSIKRNLRLSKPQGNSFTLDSASLIQNVRNCIAMHLGNEKLM